MMQQRTNKKGLQEDYQFYIILIRTQEIRRQMKILDVDLYYIKSSL
jgi:hypothetical protein